MRRTKDTQEKYDLVSRRGSDTFRFDWKSELKEEFAYWVIIPNNYPYDAIFAKHDLLVPKRYFCEAEDMTEDEYNELLEIKSQLAEKYSSLFENLRNWRSVKHYHLHLVTFIEN
jgi:diadenosine tetraphosphate (Ap4A) HIT family hydrolase